MDASTKLHINAPKEKVWPVIADIENSKDTISGITSIEIIHKPDQGLVGFKWREGRVMFGKEAHETMWITKAEENVFYETRAESHGAVYISRLELEDANDGCVLTMSFKAEPQSLFAKISGKMFAKMMKKSTEEAFLKDLEDIKTKVEHA